MLQWEDQMQYSDSQTNKTKKKQLSTLSASFTGQLVYKYQLISQ